MERKTEDTETIRHTGEFPDIYASWHLIRKWMKAPLVHRVLLRGFVRQDIRGRFAGSAGGLFWSILAPLANILIYIFIFSVIMNIRIDSDESGTGSFAVYLLSGLLPWMAFSEAVSRACTLLLEKADLITKVSFPVEILPVSGTLVSFIFNGIGFLVLMVYLALQGYAHLSWILLPAVVIFHFFFTMGLVALLSAVCVFVRDVQQIMGLILTLWMYLTPIIYPLSMVPEAYRRWMVFNPACLFTELYRQVLLRHTFSWEMFMTTALISGLCFLGGGWFFMRIKHAFGDVL